MKNDTSNANEMIKDLASKNIPDRDVLFTVLAACILKSKEQYFLLVEIDAIVVEPVIAIRLTHAQAQELLEAGVKPCKISDTFPLTVPGSNIEFKCVLVIDHKVFLVFDKTLVTAPPQPHEIVLYPSQLCPIVKC